ncbi:hypothetical protein BU17DRAFT_95487 [Hysterangium stoloniferum]|nr:hypothetical protein BU17DRAFT_95487 [Hysterangium stoloniferum]
MLESLAKRKDCNITVVLDCCHSNSGARDLPESEFVPRRARTGGTLPHNQDWDILNSAQTSLNSTYSEFGSYVQLAACGHAGLAQEVRGQGCFTKALVDTLNRIGFENVTYIELFKLLQGLLPQQNPHYQGKGHERFLFSLEKLEKSVIPVIKLDHSPVLLAGFVQGIVDELVFEVRAIDDGILGKFTTIHVEETQATLLPDSESRSRRTLFPERARAKLVGGKLQNFNVHFSSSFSTKFVASVEKETSHCIRSVEEDAAADILVYIENSVVTFTMRFPSLQYEERLDLTTAFTLKETLRGLTKATHVHWNMCREGQYPSDLSIEFPRGGKQKVPINSVLIELFPVVKQNQGTGTILVPVEGYQNLIRDRVVDIAVDRKQNNYGLKLTNNTDLDLYPYIYLINVRSLSIVDIYDISAVGGKRVDSPLRSGGGEARIGYGTTKRNILRFKNHSSLTQYGFIKIFLTTSPASMPPIAIPPFASPRDLVFESEDSPWNTCLIKIVERCKVKE